MIEITPATVDQVICGRGGRLVSIDNDVGGIAQQLQEIDPRLALRYSIEGEYFMVVLEGAGLKGRPHLVLTAQYVHTGVVERVRGIVSGQLDTQALADARDAQIDRERDYEFSQQVGEISEQLAHAVRTDLKKGRPGPVYIPPDVY